MAILLYLNSPLIKRKFIHMSIVVTLHTVRKALEFLQEQANEFLRKYPYLFPAKISGMSYRIYHSIRQSQMMQHNLNLKTDYSWPEKLKKQ